MNEPNDDAPKRILNLQDHKRKASGQGGKYATKDDVVASMAAGFLAMGQKVYSQCMTETTRLLTEMEARHAEEIAKLRAEVGL